VSAVMPCLPSTISFNRLSENLSFRAALSWPSSSGFRNSSSSISPGATAGPSQFGSPVIVFDRDFEGMPVLASKRHTTLVDSNAVPPLHLPHEDLQLDPTDVPVLYLDPDFLAYLADRALRVLEIIAETNAGNSTLLDTHDCVNLTHSLKMQINVDIDDRLMRQAMRSSSARTKRAVVEEALRLLIQTGGQSSLRRLRGQVAWNGDHDTSRLERQAK
jgi:Arc/MetJ family transcription regulator